VISAESIRLFDVLQGFLRSIGRRFQTAFRRFDTFDTIYKSNRFSNRVWKHRDLIIDAARRLVARASVVCAGAALAHKQASVPRTPFARPIEFNRRVEKLGAAAAMF